MSQLICGADGTYLICEENGVLYADTEQGNYAKCDIYKCPKCGITVAAAFGDWLMPDVGKRILASHLKHNHGILWRDTGYNSKKAHVLPPTKSEVD